MKIEVGESLCYSYLRHVRRCWLVQTNWKSSEHWVSRRIDTELEEMFQEMRQAFDPDGNVFKRTASVAQLMQQGEIDVIGIDQDGNIHALDVAFHEAGLNYGSGGTDRVLKKALRTYILLNAFVPAEAKCHIYFVSPKVHAAVLASLEEIFAKLRRKYSDTEWHLITNADFSKSLMGETLDRVDTIADTSELFVRSVKLLSLSGISEVDEPDFEKIDAHTTARSAASEKKIQPLVRDLMRTLLEICPTILDQEDYSNLMDAQYCKNRVFLKIGNRALLRERHQGRKINGHSRYWKKLYAGKFYVCSEWWRDDHYENAVSLLQFTETLARRKRNHPKISELDYHIAAYREFIEG